MKPTQTFGAFPTNLRSTKATDLFDRKYRSPGKQNQTSNGPSRSPIFINETIDPNNEMKQMRDMRFQSLQETIKSVYHQILEDELLVAMKEDSSSTDFVSQRVKEIFEEVIEKDREIYIEKMMSQYTYMKGMFKQMEDELHKVIYTYLIDFFIIS